MALAEAGANETALVAACLSQSLSEFTLASFHYPGPAVRCAVVAAGSTDG